MVAFTPCFGPPPVRPPCFGPPPVCPITESPQAMRQGTDNDSDNDSSAVVCTAADDWTPCRIPDTGIPVQPDHAIYPLPTIPVQHIPVQHIPVQHGTTLLHAEAMHKPLITSRDPARKPSRPTRLDQDTCAGQHHVPRQASSPTSSNRPPAAPLEAAAGGERLGRAWHEALCSGQAATWHLRPQYLPRTHPQSNDPSACRAVLAAHPPPVTVRYRLRVCGHQ